MTMARQWWDVVADAFDPVLRLRDDDPTPGHLAQRLDPAIVQTPALDIIDRELVEIRDAIAVMYTRRARFAELMGEGIDQETATERAAAEIASAGNDRLIVSMSPQEGKSSRMTRYGVLWLLRQFPTLQGRHRQLRRRQRRPVQLPGARGYRTVQRQGQRHRPRAASRRRPEGDDAMEAHYRRRGLRHRHRRRLAGRPLDYLVIDDPIKDIRNADSILRSARRPGSGGRRWPDPAWPPGRLSCRSSTRWHEADLAGRMIAKQTRGRVCRPRALRPLARREHPGPGRRRGRHPGPRAWRVHGERLEGERQSSGRRRRPPPPRGSGQRSTRAARHLRPGRYGSRSGGGATRSPSGHSAPTAPSASTGYEVTQSWDCAFRDTKSSRLRRRPGVGQTRCRQLPRLPGPPPIELHRDPRRRPAYEVAVPPDQEGIVEGKANGDAVIDSLKHDIPGIVVFEPGRDSKESRATAVSPYIRAGNVHLPTTRVASMAPEISFDVEAFILKATSFPNAAHDDQVDAASMYLIETYRVGGEVTIIVPIGRIPLSSVKRQGQQALAPFQRRINDRYLRR